MIVLFGLTAGSGYLALLLLKLCLAILYNRNQASHYVEDCLTRDQASEFCVVQPILSGDPNLEWTLAKNLQTIDKNVKFFWMVDTNDPVAIEICERLRAKEPPNGNRIAIHYCQPSSANQNPKVWKLQTALEACERSYFVVLDDDTTIDDKSLVAAWTCLRTNAIYTGLPLYRRGKSLWSDLVAHFVANNSVLTYLPPLMFFEPLTINGMFYVIRCETLRKLGGFKSIMNELCDDFAVKQMVARSGLRIHQGVSYQQISTSVNSIVEYHQLLHRWNVFAIKLFKNQRMLVQLVLSLFLALPPVLLLTCLLASVIHFELLVYMAALLMVRDVALRASQRIVFERPASINPFLSVIAECLQPFQLVSAMILPTIQWRSRVIRVGRDLG